VTEPGCESICCRNPIPPPLLRVCRQLHSESVCPARCRPRGRSLPLEEQSGDGDATLEDGAHSSGAEVSTDVHTVHAPEALPSDNGRLRGLRHHCLRCEGRFPDHPRGEHPVQGVVTVHQEVLSCFHCL
jgi:hypothetical protein